MDSAIGSATHRLLTRENPKLQVTGMREPHSPLLYLIGYCALSSHPEPSEEEDDDATEEDIRLEPLSSSDPELDAPLDDTDDSKLLLPVLLPSLLPRPEVLPEVLAGSLELSLLPLLWALPLELLPLPSWPLELP
jgi:hypothetical protein